MSSPGQVLCGDDPRTTSVITVVAASDGGAMVTLAGSGAAGTADGAANLLDRWLARVAAAAPA